MNDQEIRNRMVRKMLRKQVLGNHTKQVTTVVNFSVPSHERGRAEALLEEMARDASAPVEWYGGHRNNVRLTSVEETVAYLKDNDGDVPFGYG